MGDGGPVRRSTMIVFTMTASTKVLRGGRSPLLPILFLLGEEQELHSAVGRRLQTQVRRGLRTVYRIPAKRPSAAPHSLTLRLQYSLRQYEYFSMLCHFLTQTGGAQL